MNYIVFDLEWNQAPSEMEMVTSPICLEGEIIEIGAVKLNDSFETVDELKLLIKPQYYTKLHKRIVSLTRIRDRDLEEQGLPFPEAYARFHEWCGEEYSYVTWSTSDLPVLVDNMMIHGIDTSDLPDTYDAQAIFCTEVMRIRRQLSLDDALKVLNIRGDASHDALHDARNTVSVINHMDMEEYMDDYVSRAFADPPVRECYSSARELLDDPDLLRCRCPWCGEEIRAEKWYHYKREEYIAMARCSEEDEIFLSLSLLQSTANHFHSRRLLYEMSNSHWEIYSSTENGGA